MLYCVRQRLRLRLRLRSFLHDRVEEHQQVLDGAREWVGKAGLWRKNLLEVKQSLRTHAAQVPAILAKTYPFKGDRVEAGTYGDRSPDGLARLLEADWPYPAVKEACGKALEVMAADPEWVKLPLGKHRTKRLRDVPDGYVRWLAESFSWEDPNSLLAQCVREELQQRAEKRVVRTHSPQEVFRQVMVSATITESDGTTWSSDRKIVTVDDGEVTLAESWEWVVPVEALDLNREDGEDRDNLFSPSTEQGGGPKFKKPSNWYATSGEEKRLTDETERQGECPDTQLVWYDPVECRVRTFFLRDWRERLYYLHDLTGRMAMEVQPWQGGEERPSKSADRDFRDRKRMYWSVTHNEEGEVKILLRGEDPKVEDGAHRKECRRVKLWDEALASIDRVHAAPNEKELEWRAQIAEQCIAVLDLLEDPKQEKGENWLYQELDAARKDREQQLGRNEVVLGIARYGGIEVKDGVTRKAAHRPPDLEFAKVVEVGRMFRGCHTWGEWDEAMAWLEGQVFRCEEASEIPKLVADLGYGMDRQTRVVAPIDPPVQEMKRGANPTELKLLGRLQEVLKAGLRGRTDPPKQKALARRPGGKSVAARRDEAWAEAILFADAQM